MGLLNGHKKFLYAWVMQQKGQLVLHSQHDFLHKSCDFSTEFVVLTTPCLGYVKMEQPS